MLIIVLHVLRHYVTCNVPINQSLTYQFVYFNFTFNSLNYPLTCNLLSIISHFSTNSDSSTTIIIFLHVVQKKYVTCNVTINQSNPLCKYLGDMVLIFLVYKPLYPRTPPGATVNHIPNVTLF